MNRNSVTVVADSINKQGNRLTTVVAVFPRFLLAEVNTHRMFTRNSASSRAIRFNKTKESVNKGPFIPFQWQKDHAGMQGTEYFTGKFKLWLFRNLWLLGRTLAVWIATLLNKLGLTKQLCNRMLEPFMYHTALISATELENFFALRAHSMAEIHFQDLAYKYLEAMNNSKPKFLQPGEWHMPYGDDIILSDLFVSTYYRKGETLQETRLRLMLQISSVSAARISYNRVRSNYAADIKLHDRLVESGHWSALEHCARAMTDAEYYRDERGVGLTDARAGWCGNFRGFIQYRKTFTFENRVDSRLVKK